MTTILRVFVRTLFDYILERSNVNPWLSKLVFGLSYGRCNSVHELVTVLFTWALVIGLFGAGCFLSVQGMHTENPYRESQGNFYDEVCAHNVFYIFIFYLNII